MYLVSEEDYLVHYGRKGMKWYQHIFGDKNKSYSSSKLIRKNKIDEKTKDRIKQSINLGIGIAGTFGALYLVKSGKGAVISRNAINIGRNFAFKSAAMSNPLYYLMSSRFKSR